ncbi:F0F1 ATP synthase subunit A [uncultured Polaribacter sp.]|uniref:F0F1 ATP synthase subunit A n=1 Tax=uncultured Polaribacter sp. TaxID=174711 RepID=UPI00262F10EC|nr:F0F1 ATP synthase subunit A [uncultured Polaribacter sp.]
MKIAQKTIHFFTIAMMAFFSATIFASGIEKKVDNQKDGGQINTNSEVKAYIEHHLKDSHDFALFSYTSDQGERKHVGFPLPVILWTSKGLVTFMSSEFHHNDDGHVVVEKGGLKFAKIHSKIYELDNGAATVSFDETHHATNAHKTLDFSITKSVVGILLAGLLIFLGFSKLAKQYKTRKIPKGISRVLEPLVLYVRDEIAKPNIGEKKYRKFMPFLLTVFFFIWLLNLLGLTPLGFNVTGQIAVTVCLALLTMIIYITNGSKDFWAHTLWMPGVPYILRPVLAVIELVGFIIIKPFSLLVRLFANITAGHFVVMSLIALMITMKEAFGPVASTGMSLVLALFIMVIEILVAFLQAFIFTMLSSLFIGMAVEEHEHH